MVVTANGSLSKIYLTNQVSFEILSGKIEEISKNCFLILLKENNNTML